MNDSDLPKLKRRWYQISLRTVLLIVLLLSLPFSWFAFRLDQTRRQKAVLANFSEYEHNAYWRYSSLGEKEANDFPFGYVFDLRLWGNERTAPTDDDLIHLAGFTHLQALTIENCPGVTDAGLKHLSGMTNLSSLSLNGNRITDAGLVHLKGLINLETLHLANTSVTDEGVNKLQQSLPNCKIVH